MQYKPHCILVSDEETVLPQKNKSTKAFGFLKYILLFLSWGMPLLMLPRPIHPLQKAIYVLAIVQESSRMEKPRILQGTALFIGDGLLLASAHSCVLKFEIYNSIVCSSTIRHLRWMSMASLLVVELESTRFR
ncbi:hypothetical protein K440DRAFT_189476 [Wilcoxina mikolae CBS 423.85]|nr:hypothetical protein K440DRAFT_189476 [Wilcoxina mikolae CBS 423.85]